MYIANVPNRGSTPTILLRESYREEGKVKSRTLANLTKLPKEAISVLRSFLAGDNLQPVEDAFEIIASRHCGHVQAVLLTMQRLGFANLLASRSSRQRNLVLAMVAARLLNPDSKLATTRWWHITDLPSALSVSDANENDLYEAMDWLLERQGHIEKKLAARHLQDGGMALYDLTSSYFEGVTCSLAERGHHRDGKKGKLQVNYGLLTDPRGCPVSVSVFDGNTGDPKTLLPQVVKVRETFGISRIAVVGDRGMITQKQIDKLSDIEGIDWITALRPEPIKKLVAGGTIQMELFDETNLFELAHPDFPGERLIACRNPELAKRRAAKRKSLLAATCKELEIVRCMVVRDRLQGQQEIEARVSSVLKNYRIGKYYELDIRDDGFTFDVDLGKVMESLGSADPQVNEKRLARYQRHAEAIATKLEKARLKIERGRLYGKDQIGVRVGKVLNKYKVGKHFKLDIHDDRFDFEIDQDKVKAEAALDGIYVVRTNLPEEQMTAQDTVRGYKRLSQVERAFRSFKTVDLKVRPIHHRLENRVRAHILLCMLAYYVQWHMLEAWRPLLFSDEEQQAKETRDPVAPAQRSQAALQKARSKLLADGSPAHSFQTLLAELSSIVQNVCRITTGGPNASTFEVTTTPTQEQQRAFDLLKSIQS